jgi:hypothetical protein
LGYLFTTSLERERTKVPFEGSSVLVKSTKRAVVSYREKVAKTIEGTGKGKTAAAMVLMSFLILVLSEAWLDSLSLVVFVI